MIPTHRGQFMAWGNSSEMLTVVDVIDNDIVGLVGKDHARISKDDWNKIKQRLKRTTNEENYGNAEARQNKKQEHTSHDWDYEKPGID